MSRSTIRPALALSVFAAVLGMQAAQAQDAAPVAVAPPACTKPGDPPKQGASNADVTRYQKRFDEYKTCVTTFTKANIAKSQELQAQAQVYATAANSAIDDFNAYVVELNKQRQDAEKK